MPDECRFGDKKTSGKHFRVFLENGQTFIEDNSSNGTFLNGVRLTKGLKVPLKEGDEILLFAAKPEPGGETPPFTPFTPSPDLNTVGWCSSPLSV